MLWVDKATRKKILVHLYESETLPKVMWNNASASAENKVPDKYLGKHCHEQGFKTVMVNWEGIGSLDNFLIEGKKECR